MRLSRHQRRTSGSFMNMTPMIDVVFLLIIFYIAAYQITEVSDKRLELSVQTGEEKEQTRIIINVSRDGEVTIQGRQHSVADAVILVGDQLAEAGRDSLQITVLIRVDKRGDSRVANELVRQLSQMGISRILLGVESEP